MAIPPGGTSPPHIPPEVDAYREERGREGRWAMRTKRKATEG